MRERIGNAMARVGQGVRNAANRLFGRNRQAASPADSGTSGSPSNA